MQYALIDASTKVIRIQDFAGLPPSLAASKGLQWVPFLSVQNPAYDPSTHGLYEAPAKDVFGVLTQQWEVYPLPAEVVAANQRAQIPQVVTMRQARLALHKSGMLTAVDAAIDAQPEPAKTEAKLDWEYAQTVDREFGLVPAMAAAMGLTEKQIDDLFVLAASL
jgi:hypothetical protein